MVDARQPAEKIGRLFDTIIPSTVGGRVRRPEKSPRATLRAAVVLPLATLATLTLGVQATAAVPKNTPHFASPSGVASLVTAVIVVNHASSTLTLFGDEGGGSAGQVAGVVSHKLLGITGPTTIATESVAGHHLAFVAATGGKVSELQVALPAGKLKVTRARVLEPTGCAATGGAYLAFDRSHDLVEVCADGVVTAWGAIHGNVVARFAASTTKVTNATGIAAIGNDVAITNAATPAAGSAPDGVTLLSLSTRTRVGAVTNATSSAFDFATPDAIASDGKRFWVVNSGGDTLDALSGSLAFLGSSGANLSDPGAVVAQGGYAWVSSQSWEGGPSTVTQFRLVGGEIQSEWTMSNTNTHDRFDNPVGLALSGPTSWGSLWVANVSDGVVDQMDASSGGLVATFS